MDVKMCDRCRGIFERQNIDDVLATISVCGYSHVDLCPTCQGSLLRWFKGDNNEKEENRKEVREE